MGQAIVHKERCSQNVRLGKCTAAPSGRMCCQMLACGKSFDACALLHMPHACPNIVKSSVPTSVSFSHTCVLIHSSDTSPAYTCDRMHSSDPKPNF